jgi:hypothetical protein
MTTHTKFKDNKPSAKGTLTYLGGGRYEDSCQDARRSSMQQNKDKR